MLSLKILNTGSHIILPLNNMNALIDTGAPISISNGPFEFLGKKYKLPKSIFGFTVDELSKLANYKIDILLGMDILSKFKFRIRLKDGYIDFGKDVPDGKTYHKIASIMSLTFPVHIENREVYAIFDTGAFISYASEFLVEHKGQINVKEDFYPIIGKFKTPVYKLETSIDGKNKLEIEFGLLPEKLKNLYSIFKNTTTQAIIGTQLLEHYNCTIFWEKDQISWEKIS